jgi:hypothetical protein
MPKGLLAVDILPAGTPERRLSECKLDNRLFWGAKYFVARKDRGSAVVLVHVVQSVEIKRSYLTGGKIGDFPPKHTSTAI